MANPYPTSNRALVRYELTKPADGAPKGSQRHEEFELDPPTHSIAEVEKRFRDANTDTGKEFIDADLLPVKEDVPPEPVLANQTIPAQGTPKDPQIIRERAAGREELPPTVTEDADAEPDRTIRPAKRTKSADGLDELTVVDLREQAKDAEVHSYSTLTKQELINAIRAAKAK